MKLERETGFEPATPTLARSCSTTELFPRVTDSTTPLRRRLFGLPAQRGGGGFGRHRIDEEAAAPLESRDVRELRDHLEMPVEVFDSSLAQRRRVQHEVERWLVERGAETAEELDEQRREIADLVDLELLERRAMLDRQDPALERKARRERRDRDEAVVLQDHAAALAPFLAHDVAPHAALFHLPVARGAR